VPDSCKQGDLRVVLVCNFELAASRLTVSWKRRDKIAFYGAEQWRFRATIGYCWYRGADKSLTRPVRKQANVSVTMREYPSAPCLAGKKTKWQLASRCCWNRARPWHSSELVSFLVGLRTYQHPGICTEEFLTFEVEELNNIRVHCDWLMNIFYQLQ